MQAAIEFTVTLFLEPSAPPCDPLEHFSPASLGEAVQGGLGRSATVSACRGPDGGPALLVSIGAANVTSAIELRSEVLSGDFDVALERELRKAPRLIDTLRPGLVVTIRGLKAAPQLNGQRGELVSFDQQTGRWAVSFGQRGAKSVRPANLEPPGVVCRADRTKFAEEFEAAKELSTEVHGCA